MFVQIRPHEYQPDSQMAYGSLLSRSCISAELSSDLESGWVEGVRCRLLKRWKWRTKSDLVYLGKLQALNHYIASSAILRKRLFLCDILELCVLEYFGKVIALGFFCKIHDSL